MTFLDSVKNQILWVLEHFAMLRIIFRQKFDVPQTRHSYSEFIQMA